MEEKLIEQIFEMACKYPPEKQAEFLKTACGDDTKLKSQVEALLKADQASNSMLDDGHLPQDLEAFRPTKNWCVLWTLPTPAATR